MTNLLKPLRSIFTKRFDSWLAKRMPEQKKQTLGQGNIFIFPSSFGLAYLMFLVFLFVLGTNYQNNLMLLVCYFFVSLFLIALFYSYFNLSGVTVHAEGEFFSFVEQESKVPIKFYVTSDKFSMSVRFADQELTHFDLGKGEQSVEVPVVFNKRGVYSLPRLTIKSYFPLGLFSTWTHLHFPLKQVVCPKPLACYPVTVSQVSEEIDETTARHSATQSGDDFAELSSYRVGDPLSQVAWKLVAKGGAWQTKQHQASLSTQDNFLTLDSVDGASLEIKLRQLCFLVLEYGQSNVPFTLSLGSGVDGALKEPDLLENTRGNDYQSRCLTLISSYALR